MRVIPEQDLHAGIKMYRENPGLSYEAVAKRYNVSATTLRRKNLEAMANNGRLQPVQIGGARYSAELATYHCEICWIIFHDGWCVSHRQVANKLKSRYNLDVSHELVRHYRKLHQLPHKRVDPIQKVGKWSNITKVIDDNGEIRPSARQQVEAGLLQRTAVVAARKQYSSEHRAKVMHDIVKNGMKVKDAAKKHNVDVKIIYVWKKIYQTEGRLRRKKRAENYATVDLSQYPLLVTAKVNPNMTYKELKTWLWQEHGVQCSIGKIRRYLLKHQVTRTDRRKKSTAKFPVSTRLKPRLNAASDQESALGQERDVIKIAHQLPSQVLNKLQHEMSLYWHGFLQYFGTLTDVRTTHAVDHNLATILFMILLKGMGGEATAASVKRFGTEQRLQWIRPVLGEHAFESMPTAKTISHLMRQIDSYELSICFLQFTMMRRQQLSLPMTGLTIAWDAKTHRGSKDGPNTDYLHTGSMMDHKTRDTLAVFQTGRLAKEIKTLLDTITAGIIPVTGNMITADALYGKPIVAETIINYGGDYFLAIKNNQPIVEDCHMVFDIYTEDESYVQQEQKRPSTSRGCTVHHVPDLIRNRYPQWKNLQTIIYYDVQDPTRITNKNVTKHNNYEQTKIPYSRIFLSSKQLTAEEAVATVRGHWGIEQNHHLLDVNIKEDHHQARKENAAMNWAICNRLVLNELHRSRGRESIKGMMEYGTGNILNLFAQLTQFHKKYPDYAKYFDFN